MSQRETLSRFIILFRWVTVAVGLGWTIILPRSLALTVTTGVIAAYAIVRSVKPLRVPDGETALENVPRRTYIHMTVEFVIALAAVLATGAWQSPFMFCLFVPLVAAGLGFGMPTALIVAGLQIIGLSIGGFVITHTTEASHMIPWAGELLFIAVVAGYCRTLLTRAEAITKAVDKRTRELEHANALFADLDRLSRNLSVNLNSLDAIHNSLDSFTSTIDCDTAVLLLSRAGGTEWEAIAAKGFQSGQLFSQATLPESALSATSLTKTAIRMSFEQSSPKTSERAQSFNRSSHHGLFLPLSVRGHTIGLIALERSHGEPFTFKELTAAQELAEYGALSIDNARCFERIQTRGAASERTRIARDLHDRLGQSMAYVAFELERLRSDARDTEVVESLSALRDDARAMLGDLRETLSDLRTDVSDEAGLFETLGNFLARVEKRSGLETHLNIRAQTHLGIGPERELWRIAQEAITNVERHAEASMATVLIDEIDDTFIMEIKDDGLGWDPIEAPADSQFANPRSTLKGDKSPTNSFGTAGMHERAELLGARLQIRPDQPKGTIVRVELPLNQRASDLEPT